MNELDMGFELGRSKRDQKEYEELVNLLIGNNDYHKTIYWNREPNRRKFNGAAFLFSGYWLLFKSMFQYGVFCIIGIVILAFIVPDPYFRLVGFALQIAFGFMGNHIYYNYIDKQINLVMLQYDDQEQRIEYIEKKKKKNLIAGIILFIFFVSFSIWGNM